MNLFQKLLFMSNKAWMITFFWYKLFKRFVLVKNFDRQAKTRYFIENSKNRFFQNPTLTKSRISGAAGAPKSFLSAC